eukprot:TRINITY_DN9104_c0_g2_i3.p1 TRINITY_DN9104_c0_g2~~TRINITY_DN9104_c0_g2_i3.p1  ORF type:complete len:246 (-),score=-13.64 TRINITY_DN9104_c0_g2_i3:430-1167(-)
MLQKNSTTLLLPQGSAPLAKNLTASRQLWIYYDSYFSLNLHKKFQIFHIKKELYIIETCNKILLLIPNFIFENKTDIIKKLTQRKQLRKTIIIRSLPLLFSERTKLNFETHTLYSKRIFSFSESTHPQRILLLAIKFLVIEIGQQQQNFSKTSYQAIESQDMSARSAKVTTAKTLGDKSTLGYQKYLHQQQKILHTLQHQKCINNVVQKSKTQNYNKVTRSNDKNSTLLSIQIKFLPYHNRLVPN